MPKLVLFAILLLFFTLPNAFRFNYRKNYNLHDKKNSYGKISTFYLFSTSVKSIPPSPSSLNRRTFSLNDVSILDIVNYYCGSDIPIEKRVQKNKDEVLFLCPFHDDTNPSLSVNIQKGVYHCFSCNKGGSTADFVMNIENCDFQNAISHMARITGFEVTLDNNNNKKINEEEKAKAAKIQTILAAAAAYYNDCLYKDLRAGGARSHLRQRGLSAVTILKFGLGYAPRLPEGAASKPGWWGGGSLVANLTAAGYSMNDLLEAGLVVESTSATSVPKYTAPATTASTATSTSVDEDDSTRNSTPNGSGTSTSTSTSTSPSDSANNSSSETLNYFETFRNRLMIPIFDCSKSSLPNLRRSRHSGVPPSSSETPHHPNPFLAGGRVIGFGARELPFKSYQTPTSNTSAAANATSTANANATAGAANYKIKSNKYLNSRNSSGFSKSRSLFGMQLAYESIAKEGKAVMVEGYFDVISLHDLGVTNSVAVMGTAVSTDQFLAAAAFSKDNVVVLLLDGDKAGETAVMKICAEVAPRLSVGSSRLDIRVIDLHRLVTRISLELQLPASFNTSTIKDPSELCQQLVVALGQDTARSILTKYINEDEAVACQSWALDKLLQDYEAEATSDYDAFVRTLQAVRTHFQSLRANGQLGSEVAFLAAQCASRMSKGSLAVRDTIESELMTCGEHLVLGRSSVPVSVPVTNSLQRHDNDDDSDSDEDSHRIGATGTATAVLDSVSGSGSSGVLRTTPSQAGGDDGASSPAPPTPSAPATHDIEPNIGSNNSDETTRSITGKSNSPYLTTSATTTAAFITSSQKRKPKHGLNTGGMTSSPNILPSTSSITSSSSDDDIDIAPPLIPDALDDSGTSSGSSSDSGSSRCLPAITVANETPPLSLSPVATIDQDKDGHQETKDTPEVTDTGNPSTSATSAATDIHQEKKETAAAALKVPVRFANRKKMPSPSLPLAATAPASVTSALSGKGGDRSGVSGPLVDQRKLVEVSESNLLSVVLHRPSWFTTVQLPILTLTMFFGDIESELSHQSDPDSLLSDSEYQYEWSTWEHQCLWDLIVSSHSHSQSNHHHNNSNYNNTVTPEVEVELPSPPEADQGEAAAVAVAVAEETASFSSPSTSSSKETSSDMWHQLLFNITQKASTHHPNSMNYSDDNGEGLGLSPETIATLKSLLEETVHNKIIEIETAATATTTSSSSRGSRVERSSKGCIEKIFTGFEVKGLSPFDLEYLIQISALNLTAAQCHLWLNKLLELIFGEDTRDGDKTSEQGVSGTGNGKGRKEALMRFYNDIERILQEKIRTTENQIQELIQRHDQESPTTSAAPWKKTSEKPKKRSDRIAPLLSEKKKSRSGGSSTEEISAMEYFGTEVDEESSLEEAGAAGTTTATATATATATTKRNYVFEQTPDFIREKVMSPEESEQNIQEERETARLQKEQKRKLDRDMTANINNAQHSKKKSSLIKEYEYE